MPARGPALWIVLLALVTLGACDRRLEPFVPAEEEPAAPATPVRIPGLERPEPSAAPMQARPEPALAVAPDPAQQITGQLRLGDGVRNPAAAGSGAALFLIARGPGAGPPVAVKRLPPGPFPMPFAIGPEDVMIQGRPFQGPLQLSARVDLDANATTRTPGDLIAEHAEPLAPGASGVSLVLAPAR